jgi:hypothetical protein
MKYLKVCCLALFALFALAATASAKIPLPEVHIIGGGETATAKGELKGVEIAKLETALGAPIKATSVALELNINKKLTSLGTYKATFLGTKQGAKECWTEKPGKDEHIVVEGEWHLVNLDPSLKLGVTFLVPKLTILCGKEKELKVELKITVEGGAIGTVTVENMVQVKAFSGTLKCAKAGTQEFLSFLSEAETEVKQNLTANLGLGAEKGCENIKEALPLTSASTVEFLY